MLSVSVSRNPLKHWLYFTKPGWWFQPIPKRLVKLDHFPRDCGENKKYLNFHHLDLFYFTKPEKSMSCSLNRVTVTVSIVPIWLA